MKLDAVVVCELWRAIIWGRLESARRIQPIVGPVEKALNHVRKANDKLPVVYTSYPDFKPPLQACRHSLRSRKPDFTIGPTHLLNHSTT